MSAEPVPESARPSAGDGKPVWRAWARRRRAAIDAAKAGAEIAEVLESWPNYQAAVRVLVYLAIGDEPDLAPLLGDDAKSFYTTRTGEPALSLHRLDPKELERHRFGFLQPPASAAPALAGEIDLVLVPGLAFDTSGNRLGFGMGYYDRLLHGFPSGVPLVGVCPAALLVPLLPHEPHDVRMTHLATEEGVLPIS
jgi:5-formyltetrahydrofolate cyclo-ligase